MATTFACMALYGYNNGLSILVTYKGFVSIVFGYFHFSHYECVTTYCVYSYADTFVRKKAVDQLCGLSTDELYDLLPQLVQVRYSK